MKISKLKILASGFFVLMLSVFSTSNVKAAEQKKPTLLGAEVSFNAGYTTNYLWRGETQNDNDGSASFGMDLAFPKGFYAGVWTAAVNYNSSNQEVDIYGGIAKSFGPATFDVGYISYKYPGSTGVGSNFGEYYASIAFAPEKAPYSLKAKIYRDDQGSNLETTELSATYNFDFASIAVIFGDYEKTREYKSLTISKEIMGLNVALAVTDNDRDTANSNFDKSITTLSVSKSF